MDFSLQFSSPCRCNGFDGMHLGAIPYNDMVNDTPALYLKPNFPNPFNSSTIFNVELAAKGDIEIRLYDLGGRKIYSRKTFSLNKGIYYFQWDGYTDYREPAASGFYFVHIIFESPAGVKIAKSAKVQLIR